MFYVMKVTRYAAGGPGGAWEDRQRFGVRPTKEEAMEAFHRGTGIGDRGEQILDAETVCSKMIPAERMASTIRSCAEPSGWGNPPSYHYQWLLMVELV